MDVSEQFLKAVLLNHIWPTCASQCWWHPAALIGVLPFTATSSFHGLAWPTMGLAVSPSLVNDLEQCATWSLWHVSVCIEFLKDHRHRIPKKIVIRRYLERSIWKKFFSNLHSLQIKTIFQEKSSLLSRYMWFISMVNGRDVTLVPIASACKYC